MNKYEIEEYFSLFSKNVQLQKVIKSIDYSTSHNVDMLNLSSSTTLNLLLEYINRELHLLANEKEIVILSIAQGLDYFFERLEYLYKRVREEKETKFLFVFDFTFLDDIADAEYVFTMVNKERNLILERLDSPILLIVPKVLKPVFAYSASDFWSVNKLTVNVHLDSIEAKKEPMVDDENSVNLDNDQKIKYEKQLKNAEKRLEDSNVSSQRYYLIILLEVADYHKSSHDFEYAMQLYQKALFQARKSRERRPDSIEAKRDLSISLNKIADIYLQKGKVEEALKHYQESLA
ncbi:MAG: Unknown protein, partial [uncultured Sulfurovum sp.]